MKRIKIVGLCLVAVVALTAMFVSSASAASPEYTVCAKAAVKEKGTFNDKLCTIPSKGAVKAKEGGYEFASIAKAKKTAYKSSNGKSALLVFIKGVGIVGSTECVKAKGAGNITGPKTATTSVKFEKCTSSGKVCTSPGAKKGNIETFTLNATLITGGPSGIANEIKGGGPGGKSAEFNCEGEEISTTGAVSGEVTPVKAVSKESENIFATNAEGEPTIASSEPLLSTIVGVGTLESGEVTTAKLKGEALDVQ